MVKGALCNVMMRERPPFPGLSAVDKHRIMRTDRRPSPPRYDLQAVKGDDNNRGLELWDTEHARDDGGGGSVPFGS